MPDDDKIASGAHGVSPNERLIRIETLLEGIATRDNDFETRLRRVERILWIGIGLSASAGSAVGSFVGSATKVGG